MRLVRMKLANDAYDLDAGAGDALDASLFAEQTKQRGEGIQREDVVVDLAGVGAEQALDLPLALGALRLLPGLALLASNSGCGNGQVFLDVCPVALAHRLPIARSDEATVFEEMFGRRDVTAAIKAALADWHGDEEDAARP